MKREIKFRAWHRDSKLMFDVLAIAFQNKQIVVKWHNTERAIPIDQFDLMQYTGLKDKDGVEIYENNLVRFVPPIDKQASFYNSNCGSVMVKNEIDELIIKFNTSEFLSLDYDIYFIKNNVPVTDLYWFEKCGDNYSDATEKELNELNTPYTQHDSNLNFIQYLSAKKGLEVIGNVFEHPELLTPAASK
jgi:uncharacterized phage protein (TIGR01671 family)